MTTADVLTFLFEKEITDAGSSCCVIIDRFTLPPLLMIPDETTHTHRGWRKHNQSLSISRISFSRLKREKNQL